MYILLHESKAKSEPLMFSETIQCDEAGNYVGKSSTGLEINIPNEKFVRNDAMTIGVTIYCKAEQRSQRETELK